MRFNWVARVLFAAAVAVLATAALPAQTGQPEKKEDKDKAKSKPVTFNTTDGVEIQGTFWAPQPTGDKAKNRDATVLLLHDFDQKKGGNSHQDGWDALASDLAKNGYAVMSFDFRGHGESKKINKETFWDAQRGAHNRIAFPKLIANPLKAADAIEYKDFTPGYYGYLLNDVAAAKTFLDKQGQANSANLIVIGAGDGAVVGNMWMWTEWQRRKVTGRGIGGKLQFDEPEGHDQVAALWLTISPDLAGRAVSRLTSDMIVNTAAEHKVPMGFIYGGKDDASKGVAKELVKKVYNPPGTTKKPDHKFTAETAIEETDLKGSALLTDSLGTNKKILGYLESVTKDRTPREKKAMGQDTEYAWVTPTGGVTVAKGAKEDLLRTIHPRMLGLSFP